MADWPRHFGHPVLIAETFVDARHTSTIYRAANWIEAGSTRGFRRHQGPGRSYREHGVAKRVFVLPLVRTARTRLRTDRLDPDLCHGVPRMHLTAEQMRTLPSFFTTITDPRRRQGRRHPLESIVSLAVAASLCGMRGCKVISGWVHDQSLQVLKRFQVRRVNGKPDPSA